MVTPPALMLLLIRMGLSRRGGHNDDAPVRGVETTCAVDRSGSGDVGAGHDDAAGLDAGLDGHGTLSRRMMGRAPGSPGARGVPQGASAPEAVMPPALMLVLMRMGTSWVVE